MEDLCIPHSKILYLISELFKNNKIDKEQRVNLKSQVMNNEPMIFEYLERYTQSQNYEQFVENIMKLVDYNCETYEYNQQNKQETEQKIQDNPNNFTDEISSPLGLQLLKIKKAKKKVQVTNFLRPIQ